MCFAFILIFFQVIFWCNKNQLIFWFSELTYNVYMLKYNNCKLGSWEEQYLSVSIKNCLHFHFKALLAATSYKDIHEMGLRSHCLDSLKVILLKRFCQVSFFSILRQKLGFCFVLGLFLSFPIWWMWLQRDHIAFLQSWTVTQQGKF